MANEVSPKQSLKRPPGPKGLPLLGNLLSIARNPIQFLYNMARKYGDVVYFEMAGVPNYQLNNPADIQEALINHWEKFIKSRTMDTLASILGRSMLTANGEFHRTHRAAVQPMMHPNHLPYYETFMRAFSERAQAKWKDGDVVDVSEEMHVLSMCIISKALFDLDIESDARRFHHGISVMISYARILSVPFARLLQNINISLKRRYLQAKADLNLMFEEMVKDHRARPGRKDVLSMLMETGLMDDTKLRDEMMGLFAAGHETVASLLTWTYFLLSKNPEVEAKLHEELLSVLGDRPITSQDVDKLPYTRMVLTESMRLYPPIWGFSHRVDQEHVCSGYTIPVGSILSISQYVVQHDPRYYPDPFKFDPMRWTQEEKAKRPKLAYFPFGIGPRVCIGEAFAWFEAIIAVATISRKVRFELARPEPVEFQNGVLTLKPKDGMKLRVRRK